MVLGERRGGYRCASYRGATGDQARTGRIPADAVAAGPGRGRHPVIGGGGTPWMGESRTEHRGRDGAGA